MGKAAALAKSGPSCRSCRREAEVLSLSSHASVDTGCELSGRGSANCMSSQQPLATCS